MALSAAGIFEINSAATSGNVNAGYFNPTNANMLADLTTDADTANTNSPVCSSASYNFTATDVGHYLFIKSGTNWTPGWYPIASVASNKATLSAAVGQAEQESNARIIANTVAGCATTGTPTAGTFTIDYSRSTASSFAITDLASTNGTTNPSAVTSAGKPFTAVMVGNGLHVTAGTSWTVQICEIVSVSGVTATLDKAAGSAATLSSGTAKVGGALSLGASGTGIGDDYIFDQGVTSATAGTRWFIKGSATYTLGEACTMATAGNAAWVHRIEGYATMRGDRPQGSTRPILACGANAFIHNARVDLYCLQFTGTANGVVAGVSQPNKQFWCKITNTTTTANQAGASSSNGNDYWFGCEFVSYRGRGLALGSSAIIINCRAHDSDIGIRQGTNNATTIMGTVFDCNVTSGFGIAAATTIPLAYVYGCTFYGRESKTGIGINAVTATRQLTVLNSIFYGLTTGIAHPDTQMTCFDDYNNFYNNTADVTAEVGWQKGLHTIAVDPTFSSVTQRTGTTATTTSGNHLVQSGATFQTWGVAVGDFVHIPSGTGVTAGIYTILTVDSETQITTVQTLTANATADKTWFITQGRNFAVGTNLKAVGYPGSIPGGLSTGYMDIGAVQRQESGGTSGGGGIFHSSIIRAA